MQSSEREVSFRLHAVRSEHRHTERIRPLRSDCEHRRLADTCLAAKNERSAMVSELVDQPVETRQLLVPPEQRRRMTDLAD